MKKNRISLLLIAVFVGMLAIDGARTIAAQHEHTAKAGHEHMQKAEHEHTLTVGKKGDVDISKEMKVGDLTVKPGRYIFQHRVEAGDHFIRFTTPGNKNIGEVKCKLEPSSKKVKDTTLYYDTEGGINRLTKVAIAGENVTHLF